MTKSKRCSCDICTKVGIEVDIELIKHYLNNNIKRKYIFHINSITIEEKLLLKICLNNNDNLTSIGKKILTSNKPLKLVTCNTIGIVEIQQIYIGNQKIQ